VMPTSSRAILMGATPSFLANLATLEARTMAKAEDIFADMSTYLEPRAPAKQLTFHLVEKFFK